VLNTITTLRLPSGKEVALVDWTDKPLFSTVDLQHGFTQQEINLFQYVVGDQVPAYSPAASTRRTATLNDTNLSTPGAMASTEEMLVYSIRPEYFWLLNTVTNVFTAQTVPAGGPAIPYAPLSELHRRLVLELEVSQKVYAQARLGYYNTGFGAQATVAQTVNGGARTFANHGVPAQDAVRTFAIPHHIGGQEKYRVSLVNPGGGAVNFGIDASGAAIAQAFPVATITIYLDGLYKRPVS
jgi:hypothetical protein